MSTTPTAADYRQERAAVQTALEAFFTKPGQEPARAMNTERGYWEMTRGGAPFARIACEFKGGRLVIMTHAYRRVLATVDLPEAAPAFAAGETVTYDGNRSGTVIQTARELIGHEGTLMVQVMTAYHNPVWFEAGYLKAGK